jgi:hypothetical protein
VGGSTFFGRKGGGSILNFDPSRPMLRTEEVGFGQTGMAWNKASPFWPEWLRMELLGMNGIGMEEVGFGQTGMAWNKASPFWPEWLRMELLGMEWNWNCLEWKKLALA